MSIQATASGPAPLCPASSSAAMRQMRCQTAAVRSFKRIAHCLCCGLHWAGSNRQVHLPMFSGQCSCLASPNTVSYHWAAAQVTTVPSDSGQLSRSWINYASGTRVSDIATRRGWDASGMHTPEATTTGSSLVGTETETRGGSTSTGPSVAVLRL